MVICIEPKTAAEFRAKVRADFDYACERAFTVDRKQLVRFLASQVQAGKQ